MDNNTLKRSSVVAIFCPFYGAAKMNHESKTRQTVSLIADVLFDCCVLPIVIRCVFETAYLIVAHLQENMFRIAQEVLSKNSMNNTETASRAELDRDDQTDLESCLTVSRMDSDAESWCERTDSDAESWYGQLTDLEEESPAQIF